jgi:hypothetical protein
MTASGDDGRNRLRACEKAGVAPRFEVWEGNPFALAWSLNGARPPGTCGGRGT